MTEGRDGDQLARRAFIGDPLIMGELGISVDDLADEDARAVLIRGEHPEFEDALRAGVREMNGPDGPINPRLHLIVHGIVAIQLWENSPPEVWQTAARLRSLGYERHEILHMLGCPVTTQVWEAWVNESVYDRDAHIAALQALPESWERERKVLRPRARPDAPARRAADARKRTRRQAKSSRRGNRR